MTRAFGAAHCHRAQPQLHLAQAASQVMVVFQWLAWVTGPTLATTRPMGEPLAYWCARHPGRPDRHVRLVWRPSDVDQSVWAHLNPVRDLPVDLQSGRY